MVATSWPDRPEAFTHLSSVDSKRTEVVTFLICYSRWKQAVTYTCSRVPVMCGRTGDYMYVPSGRHDDALEDSQRPAV